MEETNASTGEPERNREEELEQYINGEEEREFIYIEDPYNLRCLLDSLGRKPMGQ